MWKGCWLQDRRIRVYQVDRGWSLHKDINCKELRWTVTDTAISPDQKFLVSGALEIFTGPPLALLVKDLWQACLAARCEASMPVNRNVLEAFPESFKRMGIVWDPRSLGYTF
jgi:hypothetical protein